MPVSFYMDEHIPKAITLGLRMRGVDVLTAQEDGKEGNSDSELLGRAHALKRVLFTFEMISCPKLLNVKKPESISPA